MRTYGTGAVWSMLVAALLVGTLLLVPASATADGDRARDKPSPGERMVARINKARSNHGLRPLRIAPKLQRSSRRYARHLMRTQTFGHGSAYEHAGFKRAGEMLALVRGWKRRPWPAMGMWLHSSGHRGLMLSSGFRHVGASPARGRFGGSRSTIWVVHFGAR